MKKTSFILGIVSIISFGSCSGDDDGESNQQNVDLIGQWEVIEISNEFDNSQDIFIELFEEELGCGDNGPTNIEFLDNDKVIFNNFKSGNLDSCDSELTSVNCINQSDPNDNSILLGLQGDYTLNNNSGTISFEFSPIDSTDDFIPPPLNTFRYELAEDVLTVTSSNSCISNPIVYTFVRN